MSWFESPRRVALTVAVLLLATLIALLLMPAQLPTAQGLSRQDAAWSVPVAVTVEADAALSAINQRHLFGQSATLGQPAGLAATDEKALTPPDWRISGVYAEGGRHVVLVTTEGQPLPQQLRVGDSLPGGAKITAISNDRVSLSLRGQHVSLSTYPQ